MAALKATLEVESDPGCYILDLACSPAHQLVAAALSNGKVRVLQAESNKLSLQKELDGHSGPIGEIGFTGEAQLYSCGGEGAVIGWDTRAGTETERFEAQGEQLLSFDLGDNLMAAGAAGTVVLWDRRTRRKVADFSDTHEQDVHQVHFHPDNPKQFLSASEDGLVAVFDFSATVDEDDSFKAAVNFMDSVAKVGFYGQRNERLWCQTYTEGLHLWEWAKACEEDSEGGAGPLASHKDAREQLSAAWSPQPGTEIDYLLGCSYDPASDELMIAAGTDNGSAAVFPVIGHASASCRFGRPISVLEGAHKSLVRCILWPQLEGISSITGGEDGRIVAWAEAATADPSPTQKKSGKQKLDERTGSLLLRETKKTKRKRIEK